MLTIQQAQRLLRTGVLTSEKLLLFCAARATTVSDAWERRIDTHTLLDQARESDRRRARNQLLSPLDEIPFSVKANLAVATLPLTAGSAILQSPTNVCIGYDAQVVDALIRSGALLMGSTTMDEFGMGSLGTNRPKHGESNVSTWGTRNPQTGWHRSKKLGSDEEIMDMIRNPNSQTIENYPSYHHSNNHDDHYSPGGSSSGSAVTVAQQAALFSLGSDTGGSVRLPAAWCGVTGYKPTYGRLSRDGLVAYASSMDTVGILAPTADCIGIVFEQLLHYQATQPRRDSTLRSVSASSSSSSSFVWNHLSVDDKASHRTKTTKKETYRLDGVQVAIPTAFVVKEMSQEVRDNWWNAAKQLETLGATVDVIDTISPEILQQTLAAYYVLACAEATSNLGRYDGFRYGRAAKSDPSTLLLEKQTNFSLLEQQYAKSRTQGFGNEVIRRILCGTSVLSSDHYHTHYEAAAKLRAVLTQQMRTVLNQYDVLLVPTALNMPPRFHDDKFIDSTAMMANDIMTVPASLGGFPGLSIPYGQWKHAPFAMSMQFVAAQEGEQKLFQVARALQESVPQRYA